MKGQIAEEEIGSEILRSFFWEFKGPNFEAGAKTLSSVVINSVLLPFRSQSTLCKWQLRNSVNSWKYNTVYSKSYYYMEMYLHRDINKDKAKTKPYQQEIPTYLQFSARCKIYIFRLTLYVKYSLYSLNLYRANLSLIKCSIWGKAYCRCIQQFSY